MKPIINYNSSKLFKYFFNITLGFSLLVFGLIPPLNTYAFPSGSSDNNYHSKQSKMIPYNRLKVGGIGLSMTEEQVKKLLGQPLSTKNDYIAVAGFTRILQYPGLTVKMLEDVKPSGKFFVYEIEANSPKYATIDGVKVGDNILKVRTIYGNPKTSDNNTLHYEVEYSSPTYFYFSIKNGQVTKITCGDFLG
ncbi:hypothetical protein [Gloeothece verrucosa]|uniref:Uncharacterized protein n=1 Tax=Gloeothece verrucosa (strain PCC 7822) TaxID=497965 RepID=E0UL96_GLOV7|nr:hypothetical protein [Gloeothece verrucosa]ADN17726.1 conserved hypothetical protein [Gloeothece verrucosa PCC 7822]